MGDADAFLAKATESFASAEDDYTNGRFNVCARNAYYAAFQAAVAALMNAAIEPVARWEHRFVYARFAGVLVRRRKYYPNLYSSLLIEALQLRNRADYSEARVGRREVRRILEGARLIIRSVEERLRGNR